MKDKIKTHLMAIATFFVLLFILGSIYFLLSN